MIFRSIFVTLYILPYVISFLRDYKRFLIFGKPRRLSAEKHRKRAVLLRKSIIKLGPTFIKLAQIFSSRADIIPKIYLDELSKLQDKVPPFKTKKVKRLIEEELKSPINEIFEEFSEEAIAAASLGQVHKAVYKGNEVVVKVLRPGVERIIRTDIKIIKTIIKLLLLITDNHHIKAMSTILNEFSRVVEEEMDFIIEGENAMEFGEIFKDKEDIIIPEVYRELNTKRVLVLKYYEGFKITDIDDMKRANIDVKKVIENLIEIYARQILINGIFHADPHPGNILVNREGKIILLDFGMVIRIDKEVKKELLKTAIAGVKMDIDGMVDGFYKLGIIDPDINETTIKEAVKALLEIRTKRYYSPRRIQELANHIFNTFYKFPLNLPSSLVYLFKTAALIEGIGLRYDPNFNGINDATPIVKRMLGRALEEEIISPIDLVIERIVSLYQLFKKSEKVIEKADREELKVRLHPIDIIGVEFFMTEVAKRIILGLFAIANGIITAMIYLKTENILVLLIGLLISGIIIMLLLLIPIRAYERIKDKIKL